MMYRTIIALLGLAVFGALFAGIYYSDDTETVEARRPAFSLHPGEVRADYLEPSLPGATIDVNINITGGPIDIWIMDQEWLASTIQPGETGFNLTGPFSYYKEWTVLNVTGHHRFAYVADGVTRVAMVLDHSDTYYNDTMPGQDAGPIQVEIQTRYLEEERKSLIYGYLAATPSVLLVVMTLRRQWKRRSAEPVAEPSAKE